MTTETTTPAERAKQIRARIGDIAPYPQAIRDVTASGLARHLAVRAQVIHVQQMHPDGELDRDQINLLTIMFAAAHALYALAANDSGRADQVAAEIWSAWEDGQGVGEWLWDHLGMEVCGEAGDLAEELLKLGKAAR
jgi:hypothetical protein